MYEGRTDFETGRWFGHENLGEVIEVGDGVDKVKVGERVVLPFNISCGFCKNCERGFTNYCLTTQPDPKMAGAAYGFAAMGPWAGGQAELMRVAGRHLPHQLPRHRDGRGRPRRLGGDLRRRSSGADGSAVGHDQGRQQWSSTATRTECGWPRNCHDGPRPQRCRPDAKSWGKRVRTSDRACPQPRRRVCQLDRCSTASGSATVNRARLDRCGAMDDARGIDTHRGTICACAVR
ncbi:alcohol dehydrogenase catalytic domain-containing protein [Actinopolymorpha singaporensis]